MNTKVVGFFERAGECLVTLAGAARYSHHLPFRWRAFIRETWVVGVQTLPLACFFLFLIGMVFALQTGVALVQFNQEDIVGQLVAMGMVRELGPWMTAFVLVARNGSSMAAEIGTMK
ncbi:MAG: ABC transporter permease, partial [Planctomycetes bacterium]|nr:ABC transporter permease [Planctomycetota bacterium]